MRHKLKGNKLSRNTGHRNSLLKNLSSDLILNESINTTLPKAKELKRYAEKLIHKAKTDSLHNRRLVISKIGSTDAYKKLFEDIGNRYKDRNGGYTRIIKLGNRKNDNSLVSIIEFVDFKKKTTSNEDSGSEVKDEVKSGDEEAKK